MSRWVLVAMLFGLGACSSEEGVNAGGADVGVDADNAATADVEIDTRLPDPPRALAPCEATECRETSLGGPPCSTYTATDTFNAQYGVHAHASMVWDGALTNIRVDADGWNPVIVLARLNGEVLFDGDVGAVRAPFDVSVNTPADIVVSTAQATGIVVYVTSVEALASNFAEGVPAGSEYSLTIESDCGERQRCVVNGRDTGDPGCAWLHYVGYRVVSRLDGQRNERISTAARVAWWALKEGRLGSDNPIVRSQCGAEEIGALDGCTSSPWPVGLSGVDASGHDIAQLEELAARLYEGAMVSGILRTTANEAALNREEAEAVMQTTEALRASWLLRNSAIGFTVQEPWVTKICIEDADPTCFGSGSAEARAYAATHEVALRSIDDLQSLFDVMAD